MRYDVIDDRYARLYELPLQLSRCGNEVLGVCLSYRQRPEGRFVHVVDDHGSLVWQSFNLGRSVLPGPKHYLRSVISLIREFKPDALLGCSDSLHIILTAWLSRRLGVPYAVDLYDNFESFGMTRIPGLRPLYRRALESAHGVSCVSQPLTDYVAKRYRPNGPVITLESTIDTEQFHPLNRIKCRQNLDLPLSGKLIGTAGALHRSRGILALYQAYQRLAHTDKQLHLVLAGPRDSKAPIPASVRVHYLGELAYDRIPAFFNALDVAVICIRDTLFGRYSFPQKAYEIMACGTPVIAAAVGAMPATLADYPLCLYEPDNAAHLARQLGLQLTQPCRPHIDIPSWSDQAASLKNLLAGMVDRRKNQGFS